MQHVIIGAGPAGVVAAETLHKLDRQARIVIVGDEPEPPYSRMAIPYLLIDQIDERGTYLRKGDGHYAGKGIEVRSGTRVTKVDTGARKLALSDGSELAYDRLLIATGSSPVAPPIPGMDLPNVHHCWTLEDSRRIHELAKPGARVVKMGAGFIGCIILEAVAARGVDLNVIEMENRMVPRMMNDTAGGLIKRWCESKGVKIHTSTTVSKIETGDGAPLRVTLDNGQTLDADLVITATGVKPNVGFLTGSGIDVDFGVEVDDHLQTNVPGVYAAGDVVQARDLSTGQFAVQAIQPTAVDHGRIAAQNMAGRSVRHQGSLNLNVLDTMGLISSSFGLWMGVDGGESAELHDPDNYRYLNLQFQDDVLVGASSIGLTDHVGVLRGLIQSKTRLGAWKDKLKENPNQIMEAYLASTQAVGHNAHVL